jgi:hypothetical protein
MSVESIESSGTQSRISLLVGVLHLLSAERSFNSHVDGHYADGLALRRHSDTPRDHRRTTFRCCSHGEVYQGHDRESSRCYPTLVSSYSNYD